MGDRGGWGGWGVCVCVLRPYPTLCYTFVGLSKRKFRSNTVKDGYTETHEIHWGDSELTR